MHAEQLHCSPSSESPDPDGTWAGGAGGMWASRGGTGGGATKRNAKEQIQQFEQV